MSEIRTLERCGKPVSPTERPCMRVLGHLGDCVPAMFNADELAAMEKSLMRHPSTGRYSTPAPFPLLRGLPKLYFVIFALGVAFAAFQVFIDSYVLVTIFR